MFLAAFISAFSSIYHLPERRARVDKYHDEKQCIGQCISTALQYHNDALNTEFCSRVKAVYMVNDTSYTEKQENCMLNTCNLQEVFQY